MVIQWIEVANRIQSRTRVNFIVYFCLQVGNFFTLYAFAAVYFYYHIVTTRKNIALLEFRSVSGFRVNSMSAWEIVE